METESRNKEKCDECHDGARRWPPFFLAAGRLRLSGGRVPEQGCRPPGCFCRTAGRAKQSRSAARRRQPCWTVECTATAGRAVHRRARQRPTQVGQKLGGGGDPGKCHR